MHARELVELAAVLATQAVALVRKTPELASAGLGQYWTASKCRLDRWGRCLKRCTGPSGVWPAGRTPAWLSAGGVVEEILTGEVLSRVWAAIAAAHDHHWGVTAAEPLVRSVLVGHLEARHRALVLLVRGPLTADDAMALDRIRRLADRWTDLLIGYLAGMCDVERFAVDPDRARDFAADLGSEGCLRGGRCAWALVRASLRAAFQRSLVAASPNADLNAQIAAGIFACFPPELFDSTGLLRSPWALRMSETTDDAQGLIGQLLAMDSPGRLRLRGR